LETGAPVPNGWHIALGAPKFVQGKSREAIVDNLFARVVPMARHEQTVREDREEHPHSTKSVRKTVRELINRQLSLAKTAVPDFWRRSPMAIHRDGVDVFLDLQVVATDSGQQTFGAVASAWYKTAYHRNASLSQAVNAVTTASQAFPNSRNVLYLLRPPAGGGSLTPSERRDVEKDISSSNWLLQQRRASLSVADSEAEIAQSILGDLGMLAPI
ncbi:MAG: hypothetical protein ACTS8S_08160, partial [Giesbergeria sp.]